MCSIACVLKPVQLLWAQQRTLSRAGAALLAQYPHGVIMFVLHGHDLGVHCHRMMCGETSVIGLHSTSGALAQWTCDGAQVGAAMKGGRAALAAFHDAGGFARVTQLLQWTSLTFARTGVGAGEGHGQDRGGGGLGGGDPSSSAALRSAGVTSTSAPGAVLADYGVFSGHCRLSHVTVSAESLFLHSVRSKKCCLQHRRMTAVLPATHTGANRTRAFFVIARCPAACRAAIVAQLCKPRILPAHT